MSMNLDKSLDDISKTRRSGGRRNVKPNNRRVAGKAKSVAPVGGIAKKTAPKAAAIKSSVAAVAKSIGSSKIMVSGLPPDVTEQQIKDYFDKSVGKVRKALLTYGPDGRSKGVATIIFNQVESAAKAANTLNGVKVDNKPMRVEVIVGASQVAAPAPPKALGERIAKPKSAAKTDTKAAAKAKGATASTATASGGRKAKTAGQRPGRSGRPKAKTAAELDQEMTDYFDGGAANGSTGVATNGSTNAVPAGATTGGDAAMEEEVL